MTAEQEAKELDNAIVTAIHYAKRLDDHDAVRELVIIQRRLEKYYGTIIWNRKVMAVHN